MKGYVIIVSLVKGNDLEKSLSQPKASYSRKAATDFLTECENYMLDKS
jgi:predicted DNA-binding protein